VRLILAHWPPEQIRPGDMFFTNDPWWGALHANDGILAMPIFWEGELVAWSGIVMHDSDVGSPVPGSFVNGAVDRFGEAPLFPAIRMVEGFEPLRDVERAYLRNSRTPELNALNMRARVAALRLTHGRVCELIGHYGLPTFRAAQEGIIDYVERVVRTRLREIPDGTWSAHGYHDGDGVHNVIYPIHCRVTKDADGLIVDMTGTSPQAPGAINCARPALEGVVMGVILTYLCYDLPWAIGGLRRIAEIVSAEGTLNNARSPAGVSMASTTATLTTQDVVAHAFARMLLASAAHGDEAQASWTPGISGAVIVAARPAGAPDVGPVTDFFSGGGGARSFADGIDSGGIFHAMGSRLANCEMVESRTPVLQIYRRELRDGGGPGRYRGGVPVEFATVPHKLPLRPAALNTLASGVAVPAGRGLSGGAPGAAARNLVLRDSNVRALFRDGVVPLRAEEIDAAARDRLPAKSVVSVDHDDVIIGSLAGGGGFGDPLRREPAAVARDVAAGLVGAHAAREIYGVSVSADGAFDETPRAAIRTQRLAAGRQVGPAPEGGTKLEGEVLTPLADTLELVAPPSGGRAIRCTVCHRRLAAAEDDPRRGALMRELPLLAASPHNADCLPDYVLREYSCPGCATAFACDVQRSDAAPLPEARLSGTAAGSLTP
ncbi:MAG TPA: hydantoinase B/oxoprolinase family protein, partial [Solirubrobacteraceae bacterium]|nr:hydantoinase B/oxoprolinase family protein [Solirubrobacteraceae bacterium]